MSGTADQPDTFAPVSSRRRAIIVLAAAIAFAAKLFLALKTYGTNDVYSFERFAVWSRYFGADLYQIAPDFNHPPSMIHLLHFLQWIAERTDLPFHFWIRFPGILADAGSLWLICRILGSRIAERSVFIAVLLIAAAPAQILISGFHGNTDPIMIFFVIAAVYLAGYRGSVIGGGIAFGLALCIKVVPLILVPVLFLAIPGWRKRTTFFAATAAVVAMAWSPFVERQPSLILHHVLGYKGSYGLWGFSWLFRQLGDGWPATEFLNAAFRLAGTPTLMTAIVALSIWMNRSGRKPTLYVQVGMVFLLFFAGASAFAIQYLAWLTPWLAELGVVPVALFTLTGSVFVIVVYNFWTLGTPAYLAIAYPWFHLQYFQALCWISVLLLAFIAWRRIRHEAVPQISYLSNLSPRVRFAVFAFATALFLICPAIVKMRGDTLGLHPSYAEDMVLGTQSGEYHNLADELYRRGRSDEADAAENKASALAAQSWERYYALARDEPARERLHTPEDYLDASLSDYNHGAFADCVTDATASLKFRPGVPAAWNNISTCNSELGHWDAAIAAAQQALRCDPDYWVAQQNLDWAIGQKRLASAAGK